MISYDEWAASLTPENPLPSFSPDNPSVGQVTLRCGDMRVRLAENADDTYGSFVSDAPYGLSTEPDIVEVLTKWLARESYVHSSAGFCGRTWDSFVPGPDYWRHVYRVLKPGAHLLVMTSTRTVDLLGIALRLAGFENRDTIPCHGLLTWHTGRGFPHGLNIAKAIDKIMGVEPTVVGHYRVGGNALTPTSVKGGTYGVQVPNSPSGELSITRGTSPEAQRFDGWNTQLKPSTEIILVFRKPIRAESVAHQVLATGTGALNIDACRVARGGTSPGMSPLGSHPTNVVFVHNPSCTDDACTLGCEVLALNTQSGVLTSGGAGRTNKTSGRSQGHA